MRLLIATGSLFVLAGGAALFILRNGLFMYLVGHLTYAPPETPEGVTAAFSSLAAESSQTPGVTLGALADARVACLGGAVPAAVEEAFRRINLVLLGAGSNSLSPVISPEARRAPELRPDLTRVDTSRPQRMPPRDAARVDALLNALADPAAPIHRGLDLSAGQPASELRRLVDEMESGKESYQNCVTNAGR
ncbi:hypothetical protein G5B40_12790 [Pikeienuella piscinae]|uniref:Uncharacterized protein n=1 Tax=Pikeienuella piscinae TaxID=2748098 RepID=A0A7L5C2Y8_9RHOB|nr:hypothetical protein [Pikeienuella piscinae]QIE56259.1 hypothetical protein G5B40_12790 [Pikeienuella piscinae]